MIGEIETIESDDPAEAGVDWRKEDVDCEMQEERTKEAWKKLIFVL